MLLGVALSQAVRIALLLYLVWDDFDGICYKVIVFYAYFLLIVNLRGKKYYSRE